MSARQFCHAEVNFVLVSIYYEHAISDDVMHIVILLLNTVNSHDSFKLCMKMSGQLGNHQKQAKNRNV